MFPPDDLWFGSEAEHGMFPINCIKTSWCVFNETASVAVNGILYKRGLYGLRVYFGWFQTPSVVDVQLLPWLTQYTSLSQFIMDVILTQYTPLSQFIMDVILTLYTPLSQFIMDVILTQYTPLSQFIMDVILT